jgi:hypothetical protein
MHDSSYRVLPTLIHSILCPKYQSHYRTLGIILNNRAIAVKNDWQIICTILMFFSSGAVIYGSLPALKIVDVRSEWELKALLYFLIWLYGLLGTTLCYLENAAFKKRLGALSFTWSAISLFWSAMARANVSNGTASSYPFSPDGNILFLGACIIAGVLLIIYDNRQNQTSNMRTMLVQWTVHVLIAIWICIPLAALVLFRS